MSLSLSNSKNKKKISKRLGRGNASGKGTYSGKGLKGQKSRSGVSGLKRLGMRQMLLSTPKVRGFKSAKPKNQIVRVEDINKHFKDKDIVTPKALLAKGLIAKANKPVKVLGKEGLKVKVKFENVQTSQSVK